jgi:hypothetical protein
LPNFFPKWSFGLRLGGAAPAKAPPNRRPKHSVAAALAGGSASRPRFKTATSEMFPLLHHLISQRSIEID